MKELEKVLKELNDKHINIADLEILEEINYQSEFYLEKKLNDKEKQLLFDLINRAWLKSEGLPIHVITTTALDNLDELEKMTTWELVERACMNY